ncbi:hypothetical protein CBR_g4575 [Chara braunii]|uniref:Integrase catalytic domain-containing protein n=1 Tax=Chara braunii TaxID=69332 RepID=A0A388KI65_CHABU|nr:hypothetical protein CBR_g4575 [Chara braunii]|eukprot:GBG69744.1 hypothetical protein CBR_g4575 [Chara braunii]
MLLRSQTAVMDQKSGETDEAYQARMLLLITEPKQQSDAVAAAAKQKAEDAEKARLLAIEQQCQHNEAAAKAADEERVQRREKIFSGEQALLTMAADWLTEAENGKIPDSMVPQVRAHVAATLRQRKQAPLVLILPVGDVCQTWLDNLLSKYGVVAADLHTKIISDDLKPAWHKWFQVEPLNIKAMDKLMVFEQATLSSVDWIAEYQRLTSVPDIQMGFKAIKRYFISRSCPTLGNALTHVKDTLTTPAELFDKAAQIIVTNKKAKNLQRSSTPCLSKDQHRSKVAMVAAATPNDQTSEAVSSNEGDRLAAAREDEAPETEKGLSALAQVSHDLVATYVLQQEEILHLQQTVDQMLARLQALEKQPAAVAAAGPSNLATRVQVLEDDVSNIKRVHQDFRTSQQATNFQLETQVQAAATVTPAAASSRCPPKLDDIPVFCDQSKTEPIPWWRQFTLRLDMHHVPNNDRHPCLYHRSGGACQALLDNILTSHGVAVSELHTKLTWQELTDALHKRFQVEPPDLQAMDKLNKLHQNTLLNEFSDVFETPSGIVPDPPISHEIILEAGAVPPKGCIYRMSEEELTVLHAKLDDLLDKGWIRPSSSPYARYKANRDKCEFVRQELEYLGHFVSPEGIRPLADKIQAIQEWAEPKNVTDVRSFLGLAGYYQCFIKGNSKIAANLSKLQSEERPFDFDDDVCHSFETLKAALLSAEVDWVERLPDVELAYNSSIHPTIGMSPFEFEHGSPISSPLDATLPRTAESDDHLAFLRHMQELLVKARDQMSKTQIRMSRQANRHRLPCPFRAGDLVWVSAAEFSLEQDISRNLLPKSMRPWRILSAVGDDPEGPSFRIAVPPHLPVNTVFHCSKLAPFVSAESDEFPGRRTQDPPSMDGFQEAGYIITDQRHGNKETEFLLHFSYCSHKADRWLTRSELQATSPAVLSRYLSKGKTTPSTPAPRLPRYIPPSDRQLPPRPGSSS